MGSNAKGGRRERELVTDLDAKGFSVMRAPASGSATERELPDVLAADGDVMYVIEAKSSGGDPIYIGEEEVEALRDFAPAEETKVRLGIRFDEENGDPSYGEDWNGWYFLKPEDCHRTPGGNYRVKKERALETGTPITEL